jgi:hypothetical protein
MYWYFHQNQCLNSKKYAVYKTYIDSHARGVPAHLSIVPMLLDGLTLCSIAVAGIMFSLNTDINLLALEYIGFLLCFCLFCRTTS